MYIPGKPHWKGKCWTASALLILLKRNHPEDARDKKTTERIFFSELVILLLTIALSKVDGYFVVVVAVVLTLTHHGYNAVRGHRTGSNNSGAEDDLRRKTNKKTEYNTHNN